MTTRLTPEEVLDYHYLEVRCKLLEIAAILDRYQRAGGGDPTQSNDLKLERCTRAFSILAEPRVTPGRAESIARLFSDTQ